MVRYNRERPCIVCGEKTKNKLFCSYECRKNSHNMFKKSARNANFYTRKPTSCFECEHFTVEALTCSVFGGREGIVRYPVEKISGQYNCPLFVKLPKNRIERIKKILETSFSV